ncbi:glycosyltransferase WbuB [Chryseotalea sanaruensis]|uniref:Glycosyltransferase WbuB n=1 Tax=Chryseotalea sanaruensis TaxID=2482724 RepID=A0A401U712_9BACT|nr:glycosyltransferase family 4 protein [Chryseotalea sanaruensis]GCC50596.1 glycosyltransferase WbuB [Chryseotalea sanaruensis]
MKIWLVSIFEQTPVDKVFSTRFLSIASEAISRGHEVTFWGSTFKHNTKVQRYPETTVIDYEKNYRLHFVKSIGYKKNISLKRLFSHALLGKKIINEMTKAERPDVILLAFPPISVAYEVTTWANKNQIPIVMDIIDPWPTLFEHAMPNWLKPLNGLMFYMPRRRVRDSLKKVTMLTSISQQYLDWSVQFHNVTRKERLYPAADFDAIRTHIINAAPLDLPKKKLNIIYAGSLASSYDINTILSAAHVLSSDSQIHFYVAGAGPQENKILDYTKHHTNLTFLGRLAKDVLLQYYAHCQLGMTQHIKGATQSVTYKIFDLLSAGLPILNSLESEMREIILNNKVGLHNVPGDVTGLVNNILRFRENPDMLQEYVDNSLKIALKVGNSKVIYKRFVDLLEEQWR